MPAKTKTKKFDSTEKGSRWMAVWIIPWFVLCKALASTWSHYPLSVIYASLPATEIFLVTAIVIWGFLLVTVKVFTTMVDRLVFTWLGFCFTLIGTSHSGLPLIVSSVVPHAFIIVGLVFCGVGFAFLDILRFEFFGRLPVIRVALYLCLELLLSRLFAYFLLGMDGSRAYVALHICLVVTCVGVQSCFKSLKEMTLGSADKQKNNRNPQLDRIPLCVRSFRCVILGVSSSWYSFVLSFPSCARI